MPQKLFQLLVNPRGKMFQLLLPMLLHLVKAIHPGEYLLLLLHIRSQSRLREGDRD